MSEFESIRQIAERLIEQYNADHQRDCRLPDTREKVPRFDGIDREFMRKMGIEL